MNKKAIAYLIMSLAILSIVAANMGIFASRFRKIESSNIEVVSNEFVGSALSDMTGPGMDKFMDVVSKKALQHLSVKLVEGNTYESVEATFDSLVLDGSINSTVQYRYPTLNEFLGATTNYYHVLGFRINKVIINSTFSQISPWRIIIDSKIRFKVSVPRTKYSGFFDLNTVKDVSLLGIEDPIGGFKVTNKWKHNTSYPSFIDRLNGDSGADSEYGICRDCEGEYWGGQCTDEICDDGIDNDCDGDVDCNDPGCDSDPYCLPKECVPLCQYRWQNLYYFKVRKGNADGTCPGISGWTKKGTEGWVFPAQEEDTVPLCQYRIPLSYFKVKKGDATGCVSPGGSWGYKGIEGYVFPAQEPGTVPLCQYRDHYTYFKVKKGFLDNTCPSPTGWTYKGIEGYVFPDEVCCVATGPENCVDGVDNDCDALMDCDDPDCDLDPACCVPTPEDCDDLVDNDCDGDIDCDDSNCFGVLACCVSTPEDCDDLVDNDCDSFIDCDDPDCDLDPACCVPVAEDCDDGVDNDCDGLVDCADSDCVADPACAITITTSEGLQAIKDNLAGNYILGSDIDCSATSGWNAGEGFIPIGDSSANSFTGYFDGLGHTITGLYINGPAQDYVGLFGYVEGAEIRNVGLENVYVAGTEGYAPYVGGLVGYSDRGSITNSYATGSVTEAGTYGYAGGLVGYNHNGATITNSYADGTASGNAAAGGLVGDNRGSITYSYATGSATSLDSAGGLVGDNRGSITKSYATGSATGTSEFGGAGGLVGDNRGSITYSYATGNVDGGMTAGGLAGENSGTITNSYATGSVTGDIWVGGLTSSNFGTCTTNSFWDTQTSGQLTSACGTGKTTAEMKQQSTFTNWDFVTIWAIDEGISYPYFI